MTIYKIGGKFYSGRDIYLKAKKLNKNIYGGQQAIEYLKKKGFKIMFFRTLTKRWNKV